MLSGLGQGFCAGSDIGELAAMTPVMRSSFEASCALLSQSIRAYPLPVIAVVYGFAIGGGLTLAAACDFVITTPEAKWTLPEVSIGLFPAWGLEAVVDRMGCSSAKRLTWGVDRLDGLAASQAGLADRVADDPKTEAKMLASRLAELPNGPAAAVKRYFPHEIPLNEPTQWPMSYSRRRAQPPRRWRHSIDSGVEFPNARLKC